MEQALIKLENLSKYYTSGQASLWDSKFGSKTALKTIAQIQKNKKKLKEDIDAADAKDLKVDDKMLEKTTEQALQDNDLKIKDLL